MDRPLPDTTFVVDVDDEQVAFFHEHGYLAIDRITTDDELEWVREVFDEIFAARVGGYPGAFVDVAKPYDAGGADLFNQAMFPELVVPDLRRTQFVANARRIAARLLDEPVDELQTWGHMLSKPARVGDEAPWHQDEGYWDPGLDYHAVGSWMPLDDVTIENGCLWFLPGSHRFEVLPHHHRGDDPSVQLLELVDPIDVSDAVPIPMAAGGASFHHSRTLHHSEPNTTDRDRRAFANEVQTAPVPRAVPADRPWITEGRRAFAEREMFQSS